MFLSIYGNLHAYPYGCCLFISKACPVWFGLTQRVYVSQSKAMKACGLLLGKGWPLGCRVRYVFLCFVTFLDVFWSSSELRVRLAPWNGLSPPVNILLTVPRRYFFCGSFMFFCLLFSMSLCTSVLMCLVVTCWERADHLALVCGV